jgi:Class II flagellar assembly regulator
MNRLGGVSGGVAAGGRTGEAAARAASAPGGGFSAAADRVVAGAEATDQLRVSEAAPPVGLAGMLALQEAETETARNGKGRRHGLAVLDALRELQGDLLRETGGGAAGMRSLARLAGQGQEVADQGLADVLSAIRLRAKIELLRRGVETT